MQGTEEKQGLKQAYEAVLSEKHYLEQTGDPGHLLAGVEKALELIEQAHGGNLRAK